MPMDRRLYPANWESIALAIKNQSGWRCEFCGRPCRKPGVSWADFKEWLQNSPFYHAWHYQLFDLVVNEESGEWGYVEKPGRFVLTVAHLNHRPEDCRAENLKALCAPCHCHYDLRQMGAKVYLKRERLGQLALPIEPAS